MDWSLSHLNGLIDLCRHQIEISLPIPHEIMSHTSFTSNGHRIDLHGTNLSGTIEQTLPEENVTSEFLDLFDTLYCSNDCSGHGTCVNGN